MHEQEVEAEVEAEVEVEAEECQGQARGLEKPHSPPHHTHIHTAARLLSQVCASPRFPFHHLTYATDLKLLLDFGHFATGQLRKCRTSQGKFRKCLDSVVHFNSSYKLSEVKSISGTNEHCVPRTLFQER
jgi:hypothetical protein